MLEVLLCYKYISICISQAIFVKYIIIGISDIGIIYYSYIAIHNVICCAEYVHHKCPVAVVMGSPSQNTKLILLHIAKDKQLPDPVIFSMNMYSNV